MPGPFVTAVKKAIATGSDNWECDYYSGPVIDEKTGRRDWSPRRLAVYMQTRRSALGPDWSELITTIARIKHEIPYA